MADPFRGDRPMSVDEYLAFEATSPVRHEYVDGEIYTMSGATRRHSKIAGNVFARCWSTARGGTCRVHQTDVKLRTGRVYYYPDVMVACGPEPGDPHIEDAPCLVVEVLSLSTEAIDRREKLMVYRRLMSLRMYLIIDQDRRLVDCYWRNADSNWRHQTIEERGEIRLTCPADFALTLDEIYEGVELPPLEEVLRVREEPDANYR
jgi:Uma2 family endonuclease